MGVDSGLPAFRGTQGFWSAYPAYQGRSFMDIATPETFTSDPELAWGFYGHRLNLYRQYPPHAGFAILRRWAESMPLGAFVMTSNVDGHFQRAGFAPEPVYECHGSLHHLQCHAGLTGGRRCGGHGEGKLHGAFIHRPIFRDRPIDIGKAREKVGHHRMDRRSSRELPDKG
ncbi:MAG: hypothetical protein KDJ31_09395 [Candidatus Competibacteraceae bacterium]|nr:hypothetical protein [Candidatus Competibacteraceae bacterium]MCB1820227.1 hypothetical protein [Candidatus Competibacteraceae bacterium]